MNPMYSIRECLEQIRAGETTAEELVRAALSGIERTQAQLNSFISICEQEAVEAAQALDKAGLENSELGLLAGVPTAIKDNIDQAGLICSAGSRAYSDRRPDRDAEVVTRLKEAQAVLVGRANMHELADGVTSDNPHYGPVNNPWRPDYTPGGSSGGSAVSVAAGCVPLALGTDTGGSIRIPASLCGVVGFKPTRGLVSNQGVVPLSTSLDHVGPLTRTARDSALAMQVLAGSKSGFCCEDRSSLSGLCVGVIEGFGCEADSEVASLFEESLKILESLGCRLKAVEVPGLKWSLKVLASIYTPQAANYHCDRLRSRPEDFGSDVREDLERGLTANPQKRRQALENQLQLSQTISQVTVDLDLMVSPTTPHPARPHGVPNPHEYLIYTCPFNLTGQPAISVPMGLIDGLPAGIQIVGKPGEDALVLSGATAFEDELAFECLPPVRA